MYLYYTIPLSYVLTNIQIITTHNNNNNDGDDDDHVSDGNIVLTAFSADGNHLWYLSGAIYLAVISLPNIAYTHMYIMLYTQKDIDYLIPYSKKLKLSEWG